MVILRLLPVLVCLPFIHGRRDGPPLSACVSMQPGTIVGAVGLEGHVTMPQNKLPTTHRTNPFYIEIRLDRNHYYKGESIEVHLGANQTLGMNRYKGVLVQARELHCASNQSIPTYAEVGEEPLGSFSLPGGLRDTLLQTMDCVDKQRSAVGHRSPQLKTDETITWHVPSTLEGYIVFRATFVDEETIYWTEVHSKVLGDHEGAKTPICGAPWLNVSWFLFVSLLTLVLQIT